MQFSKMGELGGIQYIAAPPPLVAEFSKKVQLLILGEPSEQPKAPPDRPEFSIKRQLAIVVLNP
jgi:hypothetical protein